MIGNSTMEERSGIRPLGPLLSLVSRFLLPSRCVGCHMPRNDFGGGGVCAACWIAVPRAGPGCPACALPGDGETCADCRSTAPPVSATRAVGLYSGVLARIVIAFKFHGYDILAERCSSLMGEAVIGSEFDAIVSIPSTRNRNRERGYDPAHLLARGIASRVGRPLARLLRRARETVPQSSLAAAQRRANVHGAFASFPEASGRSILLVDDVMTTGATAFSAAEALLASGARRVSVVVLARTPEPRSTGDAPFGSSHSSNSRDRWTGPEADTVDRLLMAPVLENT